MFSLPLIALALTAVSASPLYRRQDASCPASPSDSCSSSASTDTCCTNSPGGLLLQTQFWDTAPTTGPTLASSRAYTDIAGMLQSAGAQSTLDYMNTYWKDQAGNDETFWEHEWSKHGTCISTLAPTCYGGNYVSEQEAVSFFEQTVTLFQGLPTYQWLTAAGIVPSDSQTYTLAQLQAVATANFGQEAVWGCKSGKLNQVYYAYTTTGPFTTGTFNPAAPVGSSSCPSTGIHWVPKP